MVMGVRELVRRLIAKGTIILGGDPGLEMKNRYRSWHRAASAHLEISRQEQVDFPTCFVFCRVLRLELRIAEAGKTRYKAGHCFLVADLTG